MHRLDQSEAPTVEVTFEGATIVARQGDTVAASLLAANHNTFRETPVSGAPRGPFCMMGVCFDCLVEIDGVGNIQACMTEVRAGMHIKRQLGARDISMPDAETDL